MSVDPLSEEEEEAERRAELRGELRALEGVYNALSDLEAGPRARVMRAAAVLLGLE